MTDAEAEMECDRLLRKHRCLGKANGCYTERQYSEQKDSVYTELDESRTYSWAVTNIDDIAWRTIHKSLKKNKCNPRAIECTRLWLMQFSLTEIGAMSYINVSRETVRRDVCVAIQHQRRDGELGIIEMLAEVFHLPPGVVSGILGK